MKVIQNFSSGKHIAKLPITDILIWYVGLLQLKRFGHTIKLYCEEKDIPFLKQGKLLSFYDEVDTETLAKFKPNINDTCFWSVRKLECIRNEFEINSELFVYMDTDIIINRTLDFDSDVLVGGPEDNKSGVYLDGKHLSFPKDYVLEEGLKLTKAGFNCGVLGFKSKEIFTHYLTEYYKFTVGNPCILTGVVLPPTNQRNSGACTAEQRILKGICIKLNLDVNAFMDEVGAGAGENGVHYFILRHLWRDLSNPGFYGPLRKDAVGLLNVHLKALFTYIDEEGKELFFNIQEFKDLILKDKPVNKYI